MEQSPDPKAVLVEHYLTEAEKMLEQHKFEEAQQHLIAALEVDGDHPGRKQDIRQMLHNYSDQAAAESPPNWDAVNRALNLIIDLKLPDAESKAYQHRLNLEEARYRLENEDDLKRSFSIFDSLLNNVDQSSEHDRLQGQIAQIISEYVSIRAKEHKWSQIDKVFEQVKDLWSSSDGIQTWLEAILQLVNAASQINDKHQAEITRLENTISTQKQHSEHLTTELDIVTQDRDSLKQELKSALTRQDAQEDEIDQAQRQVRILNFALWGLMILAAVAYLVAYILIN